MATDEWEPIEQVGHVPEAVTKAAAEAFEHRAPDAVLAALVFDSAVDGEAFRAPGEDVATRALSFIAEGIVEVRVRLLPRPGHDDWILAGQTVGTNARAVAICTPGTRLAATLLDNGEFRVDGVGTGPTRLDLVVALPGREQRVTTEWVTL